MRNKLTRSETDPTLALKDDIGNSFYLTLILGIIAMIFMFLALLQGAN